VKVIEAIKARCESLGLGHAVDYPTYMRSVGYIDGLKEALKLCDEIEEENQ
jgi:hypothetical protein